MTELNPRDAAVKRVDEQTYETFSQHEIDAQLVNGVFRHYRCARPNTRNYAFNVTTFPGRLIVTGDIGTLIVERLNDMFDWAPGAIGSIDYFASKTPSEMQTEEFSIDAVQWWLEHEIHETYEDETAQTEIKDGLEWMDDMTEGEVMRVIYDATHDCEMPSFKEWTSSFLWCRAALRWFFSRVGDKR